MEKYLLLQARNADDVVQPEEVQSFADRLGVPVSTITAVNILTCELDINMLEGHDALLVGGAGEHSVLDNTIEIKSFINFLADVSAKKFPIFASCFGFQALTLAFGGTVVKDVPNAEVGTYNLWSTKECKDDPVFGELPTQFFAQLGHQDRADSLPSNVVNLAYSERAPFQAFRVPNTLIYATQFHPELTYKDNMRRFARYMPIYGQLFGHDEAQKRMDSHKPSPESNLLLHRFRQLVVASLQG